MRTAYWRLKGEIGIPVTLGTFTLDAAPTKAPHPEEPALAGVSKEEGRTPACRQAEVAHGLRRANLKMRRPPNSPAAP
jgi:hypothetical protein